jgi:adenosylhomocysteine nucleosidase
MIVVVGLKFEARIAAGPGVQVICSGDGQDLAPSLSRAIMVGDCRGLVSFGVAGGLAPNLKPGTCVVGSAIVSGSTRLQTDPEWTKRLLRTIPNAVSGVLAGVPAPVASPAAKRRLHEKTGAIAVDMESHIVASVAAAHGLPVAAIRVITDPAVRALPAAALAAMRPDGTTDIAAMIRSVVRRPHELPALFRTALDARAARATLLRGRQLLGPGLGLPNVREFELDMT